MTRSRIAALAAALVAVVALAAVLAFASDGDAPAGAGGAEVAFTVDGGPGGRIVELVLPTLDGGGTVTYASYADRPLVINFFASWCPTCIAEMPAFERVHTAADGEVAFLGVSQSDARVASLELAEETGVTYPTAFDAEGRFFTASGGLGMPTTLFVSPGGDIADVWVGALDEGALSDLIAEHFGVEVRSGTPA